MRNSPILTALVAAFLISLLAGGLSPLRAQKLQERDLGSSGSGASAKTAKTQAGSSQGAGLSSGAEQPAASAAAPAGGAPASGNEWTPPSGTSPAPATSAAPADSSAPAASSDSKTYNKQEVEREVNSFFEGGAKGLADLLAKAFQDLGRPNGFIKGGEGGAALVFGLRYGEGTLYTKDGQTRQVYWQSPSIGFDLGANASKVFTLVYGMENPDRIYQRFPGVEGSLYLVGGFGMNYQRSDGITLAPIRFGVGLRLGANVSYQHYTKYKTPVPF